MANNQVLIRHEIQATLKATQTSTALEKHVMAEAILLMDKFPPSILLMDIQTEFSLKRP